MRDETDIVGYPILPLVHQLVAMCGDAGRYVHWGATTQDIMDTANVLQVRDALAIWLAMFDRHQERLSQLRKRVLVVGFAGAAGTLASLGDKGFDVQAALADELDVPATTWHVARDGFAESVNRLALITGSLALLASATIAHAQTWPSKTVTWIVLFAAGGPTDPVKDFEPVLRFPDTPMVLLVPKTSPFKSADELIAHAKKNPGKLNFGNAGAGSTSHLIAALFESRAGIDALSVPYKGAAPAMNDLMAGQVDAMFDQANTALPQVTGGKLTALAVTSTTPMAQFPAAPALASKTLPGLIDGW